MTKHPSNRLERKKIEEKKQLVKKQVKASTLRRLKEEFKAQETEDELRQVHVDR